MISKDTKSLQMSWEREYGYAQAVKVGDTIYIAGQVSHDADGNIIGAGEMETQMRQSYANVAKILNEYGAGMGNIVEEVFIRQGYGDCVPGESEMSGRFRGISRGGEHDRPNRTPGVPRIPD